MANNISVRTVLFYRINDYCKPVEFALLPNANKGILDIQIFCFLLKLLKHNDN